MKPYEEINFPNGHLRWIREGKEYVCRMTEEYMNKIKIQHEQKREWQGLTREEKDDIWHTVGNPDASGDVDGWSGRDVMNAIEARLKEKNHD